MKKTGIKIDCIKFKIGDFSFIDLSLEIKSNEYFVITGPNGAGKTMLIKLIAGLNDPLSGDIYIEGEKVTYLPPWKRNIGYVPQDYALFPNRTVRENIRFGLEIRKIPKKEIEYRVEETAELIGISGLLSRRIDGLSGGEQQKVSIARALIFKPSVLLLDEPVSAVDEDSRDKLCRELKNIHKQTNITTLHVSHNKQETTLVADRIGFLDNGVFVKK